MKNISKEDYLSLIYKNRDKNGEVKPNLIAAKLSISNAAVTDMFKKLSKEGLIKYKKYKGITLTLEGEIYAKNMVRRHRIWEVFLFQVVGLPWDKVHEEANKLEHSSSDDLINRIEEILNFPQYDPHGDPIPNKNGKLPKIKKYLPLSELKENETSPVVRVNDFDESFLTYISKIGIKLNSIITVKEKIGFDKSMEILVNGKQLNISQKIAQNIFVEDK